MFPSYMSFCSAQLSVHQVHWLVFVIADAIFELQLKLKMPQGAAASLSPEYIRSVSVINQGELSL